MSAFPRFRLYAADGVTLIYDFENVVDENGFLTDPASFVEHTSLRGQGSIISEGSESSFDITLTFVLIGDDYTDLTAQIVAVKDAVVKFTPYVLKIQKSISSEEEYNVKRIATFQWPYDFSKKRINFQKGIITLRANCWG